MACRAVNEPAGRVSNKVVVETDRAEWDRAERGQAEDKVERERAAEEPAIDVDNQENPKVAIGLSLG